MSAAEALLRSSPLIALTRILQSVGIEHFRNFDESERRVGLAGLLSNDKNRITVAGNCGPTGEGIPVVAAVPGVGRTEFCFGIALHSYKYPSFGWTLNLSTIP